MLSISQATSPEQITAIQGLMREYLLWAFALIPGSEQAPTFQGWEDELAVLPGDYAPPKGRLLLATLDSQPAGCVALKPVNEKIGELKRLYVRPAFRGNHIGEHLVKSLIEEARTCGYQRIVLDSHFSMKHAHNIYQDAGFKTVDAPAGFPEEIRHIVVFMECEL
jgi:GNAT superfamily N-acetyltransferase